MMKVAVFSSRDFDRQYLAKANAAGVHELAFLESRLSLETVALADGCAAVCVFVNDELDENVLKSLSDEGVKLVALRCAGFNNVDLKASDTFGITVARVPAYSPHSIAEHTLAMLLTLVRKTHRAHDRVREGNFNIEGLMGVELVGKTAGIVGTGQIGSIVAGILRCVGCKVIASDPKPSSECIDAGVQYTSFDDLISQSDIISLHCPLTPQTHHLIDQGCVSSMRSGAILINTSRGAVVDTRALINGLKAGNIGGLCLDVYEEESEIFFEDLSNSTIQDDVFARLLTFPNVLITSHQAFFTQEALHTIAETTIGNLTSFERSGAALHEVDKSSIGNAG